MTQSNPPDLRHVIRYRCRPGSICRRPCGAGPGRAGGPLSGSLS
jgi:hypothetical protein